MIIHEDYVSYEQAGKLKELGFDWITYAFYLGNVLNTKVPSWQITNTTDLPIISAPTLSQVQKWLREIKGIHLWVESEPNEYHGEIWYVIYILDENKWSYPTISGERYHNTYEQALLHGVNKVFELLKDDKDDK